MNTLEKVREFHETFNHPILDSPQIPDEKRATLRVELIREELKELCDAIETNNLVEVADALCDLQYVLNGAILEFGLKDLFPAMFENVHQSNMSKSCSSEEEAIETVSWYKKSGIDAYYAPSADRFIVYRSEDNKILKSTKYIPASPGIFLKY